MYNVNHQEAIATDEESPTELSTQLPPLDDYLPLVAPFSEPQLVSSAAGLSSNRKHWGSSSDGETTKLNTNFDQTEQVFKSAIIDGRSTKELTTYESPFSRKRSSVRSTSRGRSGESSSRNADDELQQKLNKRLIEQTALEKFESLVQQSMSQNRAIARTKHAPVS